MEKKQRQKSDTSSTKYYAACETGHAYWTGPDRDNQDDAQADADSHNEDRHGGTEYAVVLEY